MQIDEKIYYINSEIEDLNFMRSKIQKYYDNKKIPYSTFLEIDRFIYIQLYDLTIEVEKLEKLKENII